MINAGGHQVGHIPRVVASKLAPFIDSSLINVEGRMIGQNLDGARHFKLAIDLSIYASPSYRAVLEPELAWATPDQRGFEHMRAMQVMSKPNPSTPRGKKDPRFKGRGQILGGVTGVGGEMGGGVGSTQTTAEQEKIREMLEGLRRVGHDEKQADGIMACLFDFAANADDDLGRVDSRHRYQ